MRCRLLRRLNWWDFIDEDLLLGARPFARDVTKLHSLGVRHVINTCAEYAGPVRHYEAVGIDQLWLPTVDFVPPTLDAIRQAIAYLESARGDGVTYVHCKAGRGRSATIALCWLMHQRRIPPEQAIAELRKARPQVPLAIGRRRVVQDYWATLE